MAKTLILNLGEPGKTAYAPPSNLATVKIDEEQPNDIVALHLELDASQGEPGHFCVTRMRLMDGQVWSSQESHLVCNMSLIIEYQEVQ